MTFSSLTAMHRTFGERVRAAREARKMSQDDLAKAVGIKQPSILAIEKGPAASSKHLTKLAEALGQTREWLESGIGEMRGAPKEHQESVRTAFPQSSFVSYMRTVKVVGAVQAGVWIEALEWPPDERYELSLPISPAFHSMPVAALEVRGPSMDVLWPEGTIVTCVKYLDLERNPKHGDKVVAQRFRRGEVEATVKEFRIDREGVAWLWPRSSHPNFQAPSPAAPTDGAEDLQVTHLVIGSYRLEV